MPRPHRIEFKGAWYHVENYGADGRDIFYDDEDRMMFLDLLGEIKQIFGVEIHAYSLLSDEYHLIIHTPNGNLSRAMRHLNGVYTQNFNKAWEEDGAVFGGRYKSVLFDAKEHLVPFVTFVHGIPVDEEVCKRAVDHKWTSHRAYLHDRYKPEWLSTETVMKSQGTIRALANAKLNKTVQEGISDEFRNLIVKERVVVGSPAFKDKVSKTKSEPAKEKKRTQKVAGDILQFVAKAYDMPLNSVKTSQTGVSNEARNMAVYQLRKVAGLQQKEIAKILNASNPYTVAKTLQRFHDRLEDDDTLYEKAIKLTQNIQSKIN